MKRKTAALYDPFLDVLGGGERHILSLLRVLDEAGYEITVFWDTDLTQQIRDRMNLTFNRLSFKPNIFSFPSPAEKLLKLAKYDLFFYVTDGSYFYSTAKRNFIFCMVPDKNLYRRNLVNRLKTYGNRFIANSRFTQSLLNKWGVDSTVIYPFINDDLMLDTDEPKEKTILAVGRFFPHLHAKKQDVMLQAFRLFHEKHPDFRLVLAGGAKKEDADYVARLEKAAEKTDGVTLRVNIPYDELKRLYRQSMFFWHFTGYGIDGYEHPEQVEHLGMTPLEAMASGTIPFCYRAGGPLEIIQEGVNGFLFKTIDELLGKMETIIGDPGSYRQMQRNAEQTVREQFSYGVFRQRVLDLIQ